ncbi:hypothetical protein U1Q18_046001, partial [Sarracenia purpurea var. burkii]
ALFGIFDLTLNHLTSSSSSSRSSSALASPTSPFRLRLQKLLSGLIRPSNDGKVSIHLRRLYGRGKDR